MDLRLDVVETAGRTVVRVQGRLGSRALQELDRVCRTASGLLILDLSELMSADDGGIATLRRLRIQGAQLIGTSPYLALLLDPERTS